MTSIAASAIEVWRELCESDPAFQSAFYSPVFAETVARVHPNVFVCIMQRAARPVAFLPFQFATPLHKLLGAAEPIGASMSDHFGIIAAPEMKIEPSSLLALAGLSAFTFHHLPEEQTRYGLSGVKPELGHRIVVGGDVAYYWGKLRAVNGSFARELDRRYRKLQEVGPLRFTYDVIDKERELALLIERKRVQYQRTGARDALAEDWKRDLLAALATSRDPCCAGTLSTLHAGDIWVASHFGLRCGGTLHFWFPVYNDALARLAPGHLLLKCIIDNASEFGIATIDRGAGDQAHKSAYLTETHHYYRGYWTRRGLRSLLHRGIQSAAWRWEELQELRRRPPHSAELK